MAKPDLSIVIVNYNVKYFLEQCLMAIDNARRNLDLEIFVVDNASVDGSRSMVRKKFPGVELIENSRNVGFSRANNQALKLARADYVLIINPDTLIQEDTLQVLKEFLDRRPDVGAVGGKLINPDGTFQLGSRRSIPSPWVAFTRIAGLSRLFPRSRLFGRYNLSYLDPDAEHEVEVLSGSLMMVRRDLLARIGYFDEDYFMYGEDIDLCYRIRQAGSKIYYYPGTKAIHYKGESTRKGEFSFIANFYSAMLLFINKHFREHYSVFMKLLLVTGIYLRAAAAYLNTLLKNFAPSLADLLLVAACVLVGFRIRFPYYPFARFYLNFPFYVIVWMTALYLAGAYYARGRLRIRPVITGAVIGLLLNATFTYFFKQFAYSRIVVLISFVLILVTLCLWRVLHRLFIQGSRPSISRIRRALIVGAGKEGERILKKLRKRPDMPYDIVGFVDFDAANVGKEIENTEVLATIENIRDLIRLERISDVIFSSDRLSNNQILETIANARGSGVAFRIVPHKLEYIIAKSAVDELDTVPLVDFLNTYDPIDVAVKRLFDIVVSAVVIIVTLPLVALNWLIGARLSGERIITEKGQIREIMRYKNGIPFIKKVPVFWQVFRGTISLVGSEFINPHTSVRRPAYKSGLTSLAGIISKQKKKPLAPPEKDYFDLYYFKNRSVIIDLEILIKSIFS